MDILLWNVGFYLVDLISETSGFCWEELLPPQRRTGSFSVLLDHGALSLQGAGTSKWPFTECKNLACSVGMWSPGLSRSPEPDAVFPKMYLEGCHQPRLSPLCGMRCFVSPLFHQVESLKALLYFSLPHFAWYLYAEQGPGDPVFKNWGSQPILMEHCSSVWALLWHSMPEWKGMFCKSEMPSGRWPC